MADATQGPDRPIDPEELRFPESVRALLSPVLDGLGYVEVSAKPTSVRFDGPAGTVQVWVFSTWRGPRYELAWDFAPNGYTTAWRTSFELWQMQRVLPDVREDRHPFVARTEAAMRPGIEKIARDIEAFATPFLAGDHDHLVLLDELVAAAYRQFQRGT